MAILGHHGRRISLRVLFHAPAGPRLGTGTRRRLSAIAFPVIGIRLFRPASPLGPCPVCPRLEQESTLSKPPTGKPCMAGPFSARPSSKSRTNGSRRYSGFASSNSSARAELPRQRLQRPRNAPPTHRHDSRVASNAVGPVRNAAIIPTSLPLSKTRSCRPTSATARGVVSRSPISQAPRIPQSWRSMSGPIAESFAVAVIDRLARVVLIPASSPPATGPADSQEHAGDLDLGDGALGQVSVLPADLSAPGGLRRTAWTCRWAP